MVKGKGQALPIRYKFSAGRIAPCNHRIIFGFQ
jgi:hypothetical protein